MHIVVSGFTGPSSAKLAMKDLHQAAGGTGTTTVNSTCCVILFIWLGYLQLYASVFLSAAKNEMSLESFSVFAAADLRLTDFNL